MPIAWYCTDCGYVYTVASDTLIYPVGGKPYEESFKGQCPNCGKKFVRLYRHKNPVHGKQEWISMGWYCSRCRYVWMDEDHVEKASTTV